MRKPLAKILVSVGVFIFLAGLSIPASAENGPCSTDKIGVCHYPPGNPANMQFMCIDENAVAAHINNHADTRAATSSECPAPASQCVLDSNNFTYSSDASCSIILNCPLTVEKLQIEYDPDFVSASASGPNVKIMGWEDASYCRLDITTVSGGNKCGYKITATSSKVSIETDKKGSSTDCEMMVHLRAPKNIPIQGDQNAEDEEDNDKDKDHH